MVAGYWSFAEGYYRKDGLPTRHLDIIRLALRPLKELYGQSPAAAFGPLKFRAIQQHLVARGVSRNHAKQVGSIIKWAFKWAVSREIIPATVHQALATVPGLKRGRSAAREPEPVGPVADHVVEATLLHVPVVVAAMVQFERFTGARPGELCSMRPCDVDRTTDPWTYRPESHKTEHLGKTRIIYIGPRAQDVLRPYLLRPADAYCFSPAESETKRKEEMRTRRKTPVQSSQLNRAKWHPRRMAGNQYDKDAYCRAVHRAVDRANAKAAKDAQARGDEPPILIPHWHPNQLRHSAATEIRKTFGLEAAQVALGHSQPPSCITD